MILNGEHRSSIRTTERLRHRLHSVMYFSAGFHERLLSITLLKYYQFSFFFSSRSQRRAWRRFDDKFERSHSRLHSQTWLVENELRPRKVNVANQRQDGWRFSFFRKILRRGNEHGIANVQHRQRSVEIVTGFRQCEEASLSTFKRYVAKVSLTRRDCRISAR